MKKSILVISLLSSTFIMYPDIIIASGIPTYTHTYTPELKPISFAQPDKAFKTAAVCFLGSGGCGSVGFGKADDNMNIDTGNQCKNDGYSITSCSLPTYPNGACPYNGAYFAKCVADKPRACKESGFTETLCPNGYVVDASCPYDSSYKKCKCNPCSGYDYSYTQATAQGYVTDGSCLSCSTTKYKRKTTPCSGYQSCECGGAVGASVCYSGTVQKFNSCKPCCSDICTSGWTDTICPSWAKKSSSGKTECGNSCYTCLSEETDVYEITVTLDDYDTFSNGCWCYLRGTCLYPKDMSVWEHHDSGCPNVCSSSGTTTCSRTYTYEVSPINH